jgi:membrane-bound lytic murein transglycosylase A
VADWKSPPLVAKRSERISDSPDPHKGPARSWRILLVIIGLALTLAAAGVVAYLERPKSGPRLTLAPAKYEQLAGWSEDAVAAAIPAFLKSCAAVTSRADGALLDGRTKSFDFGSAAEWRPLCAAAEKLPAGDDTAARQFFETSFVPLLAGNNGDSEGLFTGYYEITLNGSRRRGGAFQTPIYRRSSDPTRFTRAEIEDGALNGQGLELLWVDNPVDAFFLEIQGSGRVRMPDGSFVRVGYDGGNGKAYIAVGRLLVERNILPREQVTMQAIRRWMAEHPKEGAELRRDNPSFIFFREITGDGPLGAQRVVLTAGRSLAVDRAFISLSVPIWLEAQERFGKDKYHRLVIAQDAGGAIKGPVRGDLFWGYGRDAAAGAGAMNARGHYYLLLPRSIAARLKSGK